MDSIEFVAEFVATGETVEFASEIVSNVSGRTYVFLRAIGPNKILAMDVTNGVDREFYAYSVFGIRTHAIKN